MSSEHHYEQRQYRKRRGRPLGDVTPKSPLAERLQVLCGGANIQRAAELFGCSRDAARNYIVGDRIPRADTLASMVLKTGCNALWLLTGIGEPYPVAPRAQRDEP